jgi:hypothetical protein
MNLLDAKAAFLGWKTSLVPANRQPCGAADNATTAPANAVANSLELLCTYFANPALAELTPARLREFLSRWYLEEACVRASAGQQAADFPEARTLLQTLADFFGWLTTQGLQGNPEVVLAHESLAVVKSLQTTLPRAIEITGALANALANRQGAFTFSEFLTSFEEGGHSEYDIGEKAGALGSIEGYCKVLRVDGVRVEAEELITGERLYPILFPAAVARLLDALYIINLELLRLEQRLQIVNCGFAYPPDTDL